VTDEDRAALLAAFDGMTFEERAEPAASVVLATGTAGGESWQLIAARQEDGLVLSLDAESFSTGMGGFDPTSDELQLADHVFGTGSDRERVIFGAVPEDVVRVEAYPALDPIRPTDRVEVEVIDVPSAIAPNVNAFVLVVPGDAAQTLNAYDAAGGVVLRGSVGTDDEPIGTPPSLPPEVLPEHGGTYWGVYLTVGDRPGVPELQVAVERARAGGYSPSIGDIACDQDPGASRVAIYFATRADAELAAELVAFDFDLAPVGVARVTTYCLD
jgi:hypothetical protein